MDETTRALRKLADDFDPEKPGAYSDRPTAEMLRKAAGEREQQEKALERFPAESAAPGDIVAIVRTPDKIADLAARSPEVKVGGPSEFQTRQTGLVGLKEKYGLDIAPANFVAISDGGGPATVQALTGGTVTAANIFSTSPAIEQSKLVVLEDPKNVFLAANVVPLVASQKMSSDLKTVLDAVSAKLTTEALIQLNTAVEGNQGVDPDEAAGKWITDNGFDKPVQK